MTPLPNSRCQNCEMLVEYQTRAGAEMPRPWGLSGQKYARFGAPGGVYGALFSPAGRVVPRTPVTPNGRSS